MDRTIVRKDIVAARAPQRMCGVTGHCAQLRGPVEERIGVDGKEVQPPVYVADLEDPCLLGLDYLTKRQTCINFRWGTMRVQDAKVALSPSDTCPWLVIAKSACLLRLSSLL